MNAEKLEIMERAAGKERHSPGVVKFVEELIAHNESLEKRVLFLDHQNTEYLKKISADLHIIKLMQEENRRMRRMIDSEEMATLLKTQVN